MSSTRRVFVDFLVERYAGKTRIIAELQTLVGDDPASPLQLSEEFIGNAACKAKEGSSNVLQVNGISLHVEDHGIGKPVLLLHGWPDSSYLWRHQIPFLVANGFRAIAPDLRGFGRSDRPEGVAAYSLLNAVADAVGILDALGIEAADIVAHDWGAGVAWLTATARPNRVRRLVVLSVPHPLAPYTLRQREMAWYQLFFQFEGIAETWLQHDNWALFREMLRGNGDVDRYISDLSRPDALKASLNWYRANLAPPAEVTSQAAVPGGSNAWHLVLQRPLPRRRTHEDIRTLRERTLALRADRRRQPLDSTGRARPAEPAPP